MADGVTSPFKGKASKTGVYFTQIIVNFKIKPKILRLLNWKLTQNQLKLDFKVISFTTTWLEEGLKSAKQVVFKLKGSEKRQNS